MQGADEITGGQVVRVYEPKGSSLLASYKQRLDRREEEGFTLIELMVVVLIIAILLAIAIPTFLGARNSANARAAQADLRNALTAEQTQWTNTQSFTDNTTTMSGIESGISWVKAAVPTQGSNQVEVAVNTTTGVVVLNSYSKDGNCYAIAQSDGTSSYTSYLEEGIGAGTGKVASCETANLPAPAAPAPGSAAGALGTWSTTF